jgi:HEAT repeat protein
VRGVTAPDLATLVEQLDDVDVGVRLRALATGVRHRVPGLVRALRERAPQQRDPTVRTAFVTALVRLGDDALLVEVARALRHKEPTVVVGAARVLGQIGDRRAVPNLIEAFQTDDAVVGAAVARALGQLGDVAVVPWLIAALGQGFCVDACAQALGQLRDTRARAPLAAALATATDAKTRLLLAQAVHAVDEGADDSDVDAGADNADNPDNANIDGAGDDVDLRGRG